MNFSLFTFHQEFHNRLTRTCLEPHNEIHFVLPFDYYSKPQARTTNIFSNKTETSKFLRKLLVERIFAAEVFSREKQIEASVCDLIEYYEFNGWEVNYKHQGRLIFARFLSDIDEKDLQQIFDDQVDEFLKISNSNGKYFHDSLVHRQKLHFVQALVHLTALSDKLRNALVNEILNVYNQPNVRIIIEIVLAHFECDALKLLANDEKSLKSVVAIATMMIVKQETYREAYEKLTELQEFIIEKTSHRSETLHTFAQAALFKASEFISKLSRESNDERIYWTCNSIKQSLTDDRQKSLFDEYCNDLRFYNQFDKLFTVSTFYETIPKASNMPFEEIVGCENNITYMSDKDVNRPVWLDMKNIKIDFDAKDNKVDGRSAEFHELKPINVQTFFSENIEMNFSGFEEPDANLIVLTIMGSRPPSDPMAKWKNLRDEEPKNKFSLQSFEFKTKSDNFETESHELTKYLKHLKQRGYIVIFADTENPVTEKSSISRNIPKKCVAILT